MRDRVVIYHGNCADGFGAAFAAWIRFGDTARYIPMDHKKGGNTIDDVLAKLENPITRMTSIYILDFSLPTDVIQALNDAAGTLVWIDHHESTFKQLELKTDLRYNLDTSRGRLLLDNNKCGAMMAWKYFNPSKPMPEFFKLLDDYDRWQFKLPGSKAFQRALWSLAPWTFEQWLHEQESTWAYKDMLDDVIQEGYAILRAHSQQVQAVLKNKRELTITHVLDENGKPYLGLSANCPRHMVSDVGHELAKLSNTFGLAWELAPDGVTAHCSLRSLGNFNVAELAEKFGGGGHKSSAGFETSIYKLLEWMK